MCATYDLQSLKPDVEVHAYFAPATPPVSAQPVRSGICRCCVILWRGLFLVQNMKRVNFFAQRFAVPLVTFSWVVAERLVKAAAIHGMDHERQLLHRCTSFGILIVNRLFSVGRSNYVILWKVTVMVEWIFISDGILFITQDSF